VRGLRPASNGAGLDFLTELCYIIAALSSQGSRLVPKKYGEESPGTSEEHAERKLGRREPRPVQQKVHCLSGLLVTSY